MIDELLRERYFAPKPAQPDPRPEPASVILRRQRVLDEALRDAVRDPVSHRAPRPR